METVKMTTLQCAKSLVSYQRLHYIMVIVLAKHVNILYKLISSAIFLLSFFFPLPYYEGFYILAYSSTF